MAKDEAITTISAATSIADPDSAGTGSGSGSYSCAKMNFERLSAKKYT